MSWSWSHTRLFALAGVAFAVVAVACAQDVEMGSVVPEGDAGPSLAPPPDGEAPADEALALVCIGTTCPAPFATCVSEDGPSYKCGVDLSRDAKHCGACGNACPSFKPIHMTSKCLDARCELECWSPVDLFHPQQWKNCNGLVDDGCEVNVLADAKHCGSCGNACAPGVSCIKGKCGCPDGQIECFGVCVDAMNDDNHCGGCGNACNPEGGSCNPAAPSTYYGCRNGQCGNVKCQGRSADCNGDVTFGQCNGDGCEVQDILTDHDNCGACGNACAVGEECVDEGNGPECAVPCARFGLTKCGFECLDLLNDPAACGSCSGGCRPAGPSQIVTCKKGLCEYECAPGFGDCNGDPSDGCETNLRVHPANCGACGASCDVASGQPCVEGKCLMTTCDAGVTR